MGSANPPVSSAGVTPERFRQRQRVATGLGDAGREDQADRLGRQATGHEPKDLDGLLRRFVVAGLTVEFADGRSVTNLDPSPRDPEVPAFEQPMLSSGPGTGGGVGGWSFDMDYRVRPLPPPGPHAFACVWPARGIPSARVEVDGAAVLPAADAAVRLWVDDPYCSAD